MIEPLVRHAAPGLAPAAGRALGAALRELELLLALAPEARAGRLRLPLDELEPGPRSLRKSWRTRSGRRSSPRCCAHGTRSCAARSARASTHSRRQARPPLRALIVWAALAWPAVAARAGARCRARAPRASSSGCSMAGARGAPRGAPPPGTAWRELCAPQALSSAARCSSRAITLPRPDELAGRVIAISGASCGLGRAVALACAGARRGDPHRPQRRAARGGARRDRRQRRAAGQHCAARPGERAGARLRPARRRGARALRPPRWPAAQRRRCSARSRPSSTTTCRPGAGCCT